MPARPTDPKRVAAGIARRARQAWWRRPSLRRPVPLDSAASGEVQRFDHGVVSGWTESPDGSPVRVGLYVNELEVAGAWASDPEADRPAARAFQFRLRDVWDYVSPRDTLTLRVDGHPLPIADHGLQLIPGRRGAHSSRELQQRLADGHVFGQGGRLQLSKKLDTEWQATVMGLYAKVRALVAERFDYDVFLVYGTLLGAVREGGVIGHDVDFDSAFVSRHTSGRAAAADLRDIALFLVDEGFDIECRYTALHIHDADDPSIRIDLFHFYFDENGAFAAPFGVAGTSTITRDGWTGTTEIDFCGGRALVPENAEAVVEHLYGASWRLPKPGFDWHRDRTARARAGILPMPFMTSVIWENAYARRALFGEPSTFATALLERDDLPTTVIDIGCGDGRDTVAFAATGRRAIGLDRSPRGIALASARGGDATFEVADIAADDFAARLASLRGDGPVLFHLRFLVHAVDKPTEAALLAALAEVARPGDLVAAEFRTDHDAALPKAFGKHIRRFVPAADFDACLTAAGFEILDARDGTGLAPLDDEDPALHRVVARRRS